MKTFLQWLKSFEQNYEYSGFESTFNRKTKTLHLKYKK